MMPTDCMNLCMGHTALMLAAKMLNIEVIKQLVELEAGMVDKHGKKAIDYVMGKWEFDKGNAKYTAIELLQEEADERFVNKYLTVVMSDERLSKIFDSSLQQIEGYKYKKLNI